MAQDSPAKAPSMNASSPGTHGLLKTIRRRRNVIAAVLIAGLSLTIIALGLVKPRYTARSLLLVEHTSSAQAAAPAHGLMILNEREILRSRTVARKVIERLNLMSDPEFNPLFKDTVKEKTAAKTFKHLSVYGSELSTLPPEVVDRSIAHMITNFQQKLKVSSIPGSFALQIEFTSLDPNKAALITNAIADIYIEQRLEEKLRATKKLTAWLDGRMLELREQLSGLNDQIVTAQAENSDAQAQIIRRPGQIKTAQEVINSSLVTRLKVEAVTLSGELSELSGRYGSKHPAIINLKSKLGEVKKAIRAEMVKTTKPKRKISDISPEELEEQRYKDSDALVKLSELEREAASASLILKAFQKAYERLAQKEELQEPEARVLSYAIVPLSASFPDRALFLSISGLISLLMGFAFALLIERLDNSFRSPGQLETMARFPCYGLIPLVEKMDKLDLSGYVLSKPSSTVAESVRTLRMVLKLRAPSDDKPKVVSVTSSFPAEGKTTLSVWLARLAAKSGEKVIIIDADLRRPNVHKALGQDNDTSLVEYLTGKKELNEVIKKDASTGAHMIYGRSVPNSALDLVSSDKFASLVSSLRQVYDLIIIDSPACLAVPDARVLANMSDQMLYAVSWDKTQREAIMSGVKQFADMGYEKLAFVLTNVDVRRHVRYGYGDTVYCYGRYGEYCAE